MRKKVFLQKKHLAMCSCIIILHSFFYAFQMEKLKLACAEGDLDTVKELTDCEVDTETKDDSKVSVLLNALVEF